MKYLFTKTVKWEAHQWLVDALQALHVVQRRVHRAIEFLHAPMDSESLNDEVRHGTQNNIAGERLVLGEAYLKRERQQAD